MFVLDKLGSASSWSTQHMVHRPTSNQHDPGNALVHNSLALTMMWKFLFDAASYEAKYTINKLCGRPPQYAPAPCKLTFDLLILKVVSESRVTCATSVPFLVFLGLSVLDLGPMYATDKRQTRIIA